MTQEESFIGDAIDTVETTFTQGIAGTLFDIAKKVSSSTFKVISDRRKATQASKKYADRYQKRYGLLKLLGMPQGLALESIYTPVRVLNELSVRQFETIPDLEENYRNTSRRRLQIGECRSEDGLTVAQRNQYLMVLGNPGAGKSTFLRRMGLEAFKGKSGKFKDECIPVLLELKRFNTEQVDLIGAIAEEFIHFGFPPSPEFAIKALEAGKLLVLFDGLDEVPSELTNLVMKAIDSLVTSYEQNRFVASCRIAAYRSNFQHDFQVIELADFYDEQIQQFITNWFSTERDLPSKTAERCWETLNHESNVAAKELAQTPLLLTFLCLVYNRKQSFPPTRSRLYNKALDILLEEWAAEKRLQQEQIYEGLHTDLEKVMLAEIAYEEFKHDRLFFDEQQIVKSITESLADSVENPKYLDGKKILNAITAQQGILVQRAEDIYSFSHLTLQEYLTAQYINEDKELVRQLIGKHLTDERWREVFLLVAGLKNDASKFLLAIEKATQGLMNTDKLHNLLAWTKHATNDSPGDIQLVEKRAIVLANAYAYANTYTYAYLKVYILVSAYALNLSNAYAFAYALANAYAFTKPKQAFKYFIEYANWSKKFQIYQGVNYDELVNSLEKLNARIPEQGAEIEVHRVFGKQAIAFWLKAFKLRPEMLDLSNYEHKALKNYLYANLLLVECKRVAVRVSQRTWSEIESRMLMPFREPT